MSYFWRNLQVLIERKTSGVISRKEQRSDRSSGSKTEENWKSARLCITRNGRATAVATPHRWYDHMHGRAFDRAPVHDRRCIEAWPCVGPIDLAIFRPFIWVSLPFLGETSWLGFHGRQLGFEIPQKNLIKGRFN